MEDYTLPFDGKVNIAVYNILGQQVTTLISEFQEAGFHQVVFEANHLSSGVYLVVMQSGAFMDTKKIIMIK